MLIHISTSAEKPISFRKFAKDFYTRLRDSDVPDEKFYKANKKAMLDAIKAASEEDITKALSDDVCRTLYPSGWPYGPYPGKLAKALVKSKAEESLTDLTNPFYAFNRELTAEARKVFFDFLVAHPKKFLSQCAYSFDLSQDVLKEGADAIAESLPYEGYENVSPGFDRFYEASPATAKKLLMLLPKDVLQAIERTVPDWVKSAKK